MFDRIKKTHDILTDKVPPASPVAKGETVQELAHKWVIEQSRLGEQTDHMKGLSQYRTDAAEQAFIAGYRAAQPTRTPEQVREALLRIAQDLRSDAQVMNDPRPFFAYATRLEKLAAAPQSQQQRKGK